jgi:hypothetical protein
VPQGGLVEVVREEVDERIVPAAASEGQERIRPSSGGIGRIDPIEIHHRHDRRDRLTVPDDERSSEGSLGRVDGVEAVSR